MHEGKLELILHHGEDIPPIAVEVPIPKLLKHSFGVMSICSAMERDIERLTLLIAAEIERRRAVDFTFIRYGEQV